MSKAKHDASPKGEMLRRLQYLVKELAKAGQHEASQDLSRSVRSLHHTLSREAGVQEVVAKTLMTVLRHEVTLDGKLISTLGHLAHEVGIRLVENPAMLIAVAISTHDNPDRQVSEEQSRRVDKVAAVLLDEYKDAPYEEVVEAARWMAEITDLPATEAELTDMQREIHEAEAQGQRSQRVQEQAIQIEETTRCKPPEDDPDYGWAIKALLTFLALVAVAGAVIEAIENPMGAVRRLWSDQQ